MKVFIITTSSFPYGMADTNRIKCYAKAIIEQNVDCEVVVYKRNSGFSNTIPFDVYEGIPYRYVGGDCVRHKGSVKSRLNDITDRINLYLYIKKNILEGDVVFCYGSLYSSILIKMVHRKGGVFVENLTEYPFLFAEKSIFRRFYKRLVLNKLFPCFDGVVVISDELKKYAGKFVNPDCRFIKLPILVEYSKYILEDTSSSQVTKYIFHAGSLLESKDGILGMLSAFGIAKKESKNSFKFICTGTIDKSPHAQSIREIIAHYGIENDVIFTGFLSDEEYHNYLQGASLVIINKYNTLQNKYCFSTKLSEYMAAGKPIIITKVGEAMNWVTDNKDVLIVNPEDTHKLAAAINKMFEDNELREKLGKAARETCKNSFDYKVHSLALVQFFKSCSNAEA